MVKKGLIMCLTVVCGIALVQADQLLYNRFDFEYVESQGYYVLGSNPSPSYTYATNTNLKGVVTNVQSYTGTQSMVVANSGATTMSGFEGVAFTPTADGLYVLSADMYVSSQYNSVVTSYAVGLYARSATGTQYPCAARLVKNDAGVTSLSYISGAAYLSEAVSASLFEDKWVVIEMTIDDPNDKYSFTIYNADKTQVIASKTDLNFYGASTVDGIRVYTEKARAAKPVQVYYDNLSVESVPEPATMSLLVAGFGLALLKRK